MKRKLLALNLAFLAIAVLLGSTLRRRWIGERERERSVAGRQAKPTPAPPSAELAPVQPVTAVAYEEVAQKMLFARDRNPNVEIEVAPKKPMPALPAAHGFMNLGGTPVVILTEKSGAPQKSYRPGDQVGQFKLASVDASVIVFEWEDQTIERPLAELLEAGTKQPGAVPGAVAAVQQPAAASASTSATIDTVGTSKAGPGAAMSGEVRACQPGDASPPGAIVGGLRKVVSESPFSPTGKTCRWEPVR